MGGETGRESSGPIRRFPAGFWASFNIWWHTEYARLGQRPSSKAIIKWHEENAVKIWGDQAVSYQETQRHANRMKCRRTGLHLQRHTSMDEDDEDEDCYPDGPHVDASDKGGTESANGGGCQRPTAVTSAADRPSAMDSGGSRLSPAKALPPAPPTAATRVKFDAHSDPPGALTTCYMNTDSDLPAPAAPCIDFLNRYGDGAAQPDTKTAPWMHPDPTAPPGLPPGSGGDPSESQDGMSFCNAAHMSCMSWGSSSSLLCGPLSGNVAGFGSVRELETSGDCGSGPGGSGSGSGVGTTAIGMGLPSALWNRAAKRTRDSAAVVACGGPCPSDGIGNDVMAAPRHSTDQLLQLQPEIMSRRPLPPPRVNPFAEVAAAAAAAAGLPAVTSVPAARDAAALLLSAAAMAPPRVVPRLNLRVEPPWLQRAGVELDAIMREVGLFLDEAKPTGVLPGVLGRPRVLCSSDPLRLPEPSKRRNLDSILLRGLQREGGCEAVCGNIKQKLYG